ncbi:MAG TPA: hypothetical protein VG841_01120 [Caulobacterales bacterium]|nr:hypothetical protein [Caulobacterales bacterium]
MMITLAGLASILAGISAAIASLAAVGALRSYIQDVKHKQTHWLYELFRDFYENNTFIGVRRTLEYGQNPELNELRKAIQCNPTPREGVEIADAFCNYLNFFEFMCNLVERRRLDRKDLERSFQFYLDNLASHRFVVEYIFEESNGFEALRKELRHHRDKFPNDFAERRWSFRRGLRPKNPLAELTV